MAKYTFELLKPSDTKSIKGVYKLWTDAYGVDEVEPIEVTKAGMRGEGGILYRIHAAKDEEGKVVAAIAGGVDKLDGKRAVYMVGYMNTDPVHQLKGLARKLFQLAVEQAQIDAKAGGRRLAAISAEATSSSEAFWNSVGLNRVYVGAGVKVDEYSELPYVQPALDFDTSTGLPVEGAGEAAEHLMLGFVENEADKELVSLVVDAIYRWSHLWPAEDFESMEAHQANVGYVSKFKQEFDEFLFGSGEMAILTAEDRKNLTMAGAIIHEYTAADV
jgi:GNAT superfamily N-acetyltransferase